MLTQEHQKLLIDKSSGFFSVPDVVHLCRMGHYSLDCLHLYFFIPLFISLRLVIVCSANPLPPLFFSNLYLWTPPQVSVPALPPCPTISSHLCARVSSSVPVASRASSAGMTEIDQPALTLPELETCMSTFPVDIAP